MNYRVTILPQAELDVREIVSYYKSISTEIATKFKKNINLEFKKLKINPFLFQIKYNNYRTLKINKFPYLIHFEIKDYTVIILAIYHSSRESKIFHI